MEHPPLYSDTDPRAMEVWLDLLRKVPPGDKLKAALDLSDLVFHMSETGVRIQHPRAESPEVFLRAAARHLGRDLLDCHGRSAGGVDTKKAAPAAGSAAPEACARWSTSQQ